MRYMCSDYSIAMEERLERIELQLSIITNMLKDVLKGRQSAVVVPSASEAATVPSLTKDLLQETVKDGIRAAGDDMSNQMIEHVSLIIEELRTLKADPEAIQRIASNPGESKAFVKWLEGMLTMQGFFLTFRNV